MSKFEITLQRDAHEQIHIPHKIESLESYLQMADSSHVESQCIFEFLHTIKIKIREEGKKHAKVFSMSYVISQCTF